MRRYAWMAAIGGLLSVVSQADDIQVYTGGNNGATPNILLIVDTSRSMSSFVRPLEAYNPLIRYDDYLYGFDPDGVYVYRAPLVDMVGNAPNTALANSWDDKTIYIDPFVAGNIKRYQVSADSISCPKANFLATFTAQGFYEADWAFWRPGRAARDSFVDGDGTLGWTGPSRDIDRYYQLDDVEDLPTVDMDAGHITQCYMSNASDRPYSFDANGDGIPETYRYMSYRDGSLPYGDDYSYAATTYHYNLLMSGNYLNWLAHYTESRMDVVRRAVKYVANNMDGINLGLMRYSSSDLGGFVDIAIKPVAEARDQISTRIDEYGTYLATPISETLYEAQRYFAGLDEEHGRNSYMAYTYAPHSRYYLYRNASSIFDDGHLLGYHLHSDYVKGGDPSVWVDPDDRDTYIAPAALECTPSKIMMFTDGEPLSDVSDNSDIKRLIQYMDMESRSYLSKSCSGEGGCAEEIAYYLSHADQRADLDGIQTVSVDTMGGFVDGNPAAQQILHDIAEAGQGTFYQANSYDEIVAQLLESFRSVKEDPSTFVSPTIAVNSFNSLEQSDEIYFSVFQPSRKTDWKGNLKRYRMRSDGQIVTDIGQSYDPETGESASYVEGPAIDPDTGFFRLEARSYWSEEADGYFVSSGGMASRLTEERNVWTSVNGTRKTIRVTIPANGQPAADGSHLDTGLASSVLTKARLGATDYSDVEQVQLIEWIAGLDRTMDSTGTDILTARKEIEDPLHSEPVIINYSENQRVLFVGTNSGYLHAFNIDLDEPGEIFSFLPEELLKNPRWYFDPVQSYDKVYGMDGKLSYWHKDVSNDGSLPEGQADGVVNGNDRVLLFAGMRRGGSSYYALDVTDPENPTLAWQINGPYQDTTKNTPSVTAGFSGLGQTWSVMDPADIRWNGSTKTVLFFTGGYDGSADASGLRTSDSYGHNVYMVDAETGALLWSAERDTLTSAEMTYSIAGDPVAIDRDSDGFTDLLYTADTGGNVWRFDFNENADSALNFASGGKIASLAGSTDSTDIRFYTSPDISWIEDEGEAFILISIGAGNRADPLDVSVQNRHFLLKDPLGKAYPTAGYPLTEGSQLAVWGSGPSTKGWYIPLNSTGEKALASSVTIQGNIFFTTYSPLDGVTAQSCGGDAGQSRLYSLNIYSKTTAARSVTLDQSFIPGEIKSFVASTQQLLEEAGEVEDVIQQGGDCDGMSIFNAIGTGSEDTGLNRCDQVSRRYWREDP